MKFNVEINLLGPADCDRDTPLAYGRSAGGYPILSQGKLSGLTVSNLRQLLAWVLDKNKIDGLIATAVEFGRSVNSCGNAGTQITLTVAKGDK